MEIGVRSPVFTLRRRSLKFCRHDGVSELGLLGRGVWGWGRCKSGLKPHEGGHVCMFDRESEFGVFRGLGLTV